MTHHRTRLTPLALSAFAALALTGPATTATAEPAKEDASSFKWENEELNYKVKIQGSEAVHARIRVGEVRSMKGLPYVALSAVAKSVGLFHSIYPMDDRANTFIHPDTLQPHRSEKLFREAGKVRSYNVDYELGRYRAAVNKLSEQDGETKKRKYSRAIPSETHTALSWIFELRQADGFTVGEELSFYVYDGWKLSRLDLKVAAEESVYTPMGWHKAWKLDFSRAILSSRHNRKGKRHLKPKLKERKAPEPTGSIWISTDSRRLPLKIAMTSMYGVGEVLLVSYNQAKARPKK